MFRISGALPSYEGAIVQIALNRFEERLRVANHIELDPPDQPTAARGADALVWICEAVLGEPGSTEGPSAPPARIVVHADYDLLTGANSNGRGHLEDGPVLSTARLRQLSCDATLKPLIERSGEAIATGREKPTVSPELKLRGAAATVPAATPAARFRRPDATPTTSITGSTADRQRPGTSCRSASTTTTATTRASSTSAGPSAATCGS